VIPLPRLDLGKIRINPRARPLRPTRDAAGLRGIETEVRRPLGTEKLADELTREMQTLQLRVALAVDRGFQVEFAVGIEEPEVGETPPLDGLSILCLAG
jgi:hypothetical protein